MPYTGYRTQVALARQIDTEHRPALGLRRHADFVSVNTIACRGGPACGGRLAFAIIPQSRAAWTRSRPRDLVSLWGTGLFHRRLGLVQRVASRGPEVLGSHLWRR